MLVPFTPEQEWTRRNRRLVAHVTVSAVFTTAALVSSTAPWIYLATCNAPPDAPFGGGEGIGAFITTVIALPVGIASAGALTVWSVRLARHRRLPPPGLRWKHSTVRITPTLGGLRISF